MKFISKLLLLLSYTLLAGGSMKGVWAQPSGTWNTLSAKGSIGGNWNVFGEFQLRSLSFYDRYYYYELKGGATYTFNKRFALSMGTGLYNTFREGMDYEGYVKRKEFRIWEQFEMDQKLSIFSFEHRLRVEQRFAGNYASRFRYRFHLTFPINNKEIEPGTLYGAVYDELFGADIAQVLVRNRFYAGAGFRVSDKVTFQVGWLSQTDYSYPGSNTLPFFAATLSFNLGSPPASGSGLIED